MWKYEEMPEEDHLKFYFDKFGGRNGDKKEKKEKQTAVAASPAAGIITSKPF
jgi:hypothetical protein